jgi:hypothetical protein
MQIGRNQSRSAGMSLQAEREVFRDFFAAVHESVAGPSRHVALKGLSVAFAE